MDTSALLCHVVCTSKNAVIGHNGFLPWHVAKDLAHFKSLTMGSPLIMGRKTWQSLPGTLPGRDHIVISRNPQLSLPKDASVRTNVTDAIHLAKEIAHNKNIFIIGGAEIYQATLPHISYIYHTLLDIHAHGNTYYPLASLQEFSLKEERAEQVLYTAKNPANENGNSKMITAFFRTYKRNTQTAKTNTTNIAKSS